MGLLQGKVALITGAARGQGRSHAVRMAQEGADIIAVDGLTTPEWATYEQASADDLAQTAEQVKKEDRRIVARQADVRDLDSLSDAVGEGVAELGGIDIICANAGVIPAGCKTWEIDSRQWRDVLDINLTGAFHTVKVGIPHLIERAPGGSIVLTSSGAALVGTANFADYSAAKTGLLSLTRTLATELAEHHIRVNAVCPTSVDTAMIQNEALYRVFRPDLDNPGRADVADQFQSINLLPIPWIDPVDVSNAIVWLASDQARYVTGVTLPVDAGHSVKC